MKCFELYENIKKYWSSSVLLNEDTFETLNSIYWELESKIDQDSEHWLNVSSWAFHQTVWIYAKLQIDSGKKVIKVSEIPISLFNEQMLSNLEDESWIEEHQEYVQL